MLTFDTYLAPKPDKILARYFKRSGMRIVELDNSKDTEAAKLWSLGAYAWNILLEKEIHEYARQNGLNFDTIYRLFTDSHNKGYQEMGMNNVTRPVLDHMDGPIGGHCIIAACEKLQKDSRLARVILNWNSRY